MAALKVPYASTTPKLKSAKKFESGLSKLINGAAGPASPNVSDEMMDDLTSVNLSEEDEQHDKKSNKELLDLLAGKHRFKDDAKIIHIAIIDYLTRYTPLKKLEKHFKPI